MLAATAKVYGLTLVTRNVADIDRYRRRVWSQQKRAIYRFMNIKLMRDMD